jgi:hypothetical protein
LSLASPRVLPPPLLPRLPLLLQKEELLKLAMLPRLLQLMEGQAADAEAAYAAAGCLACLAQHPKWLAEVSATGAVANKVCVSLVHVAQLAGTKHAVHMGRGAVWWQGDTACSQLQQPVPRLAMTQCGALKCGRKTARL